jgi:four helix bundle protein
LAFLSDLISRLEPLIDRTIQMALALPRNVAGQEIGRQIIRSSGSVGSNAEEARAMLTRRSYTHKLSISLGEARETLFWIRRIIANQLLRQTRLEPLRHDWDEVVCMLTTAQKKLRSKAK